MPRSPLLLMAGIACALLAMLAREPDTDEALQLEAARLQGAVHDGHGELGTLTQQLASSLAQLGPEAWMVAHASDLEREAQRSGTVFLGLLGDSVVCWSGDPSLPTPGLQDRAASHIRSRNGTWLHAQAQAGTLSLHGVRPVWLTPPIENRYLSKGFHPSWKAPPGLWAGREGSGPTISDQEGKPMFQLGWRDGALEVGHWLFFKGFLLVLSMLCLVLWWWRISMHLVRVGRPWRAALVFLAGLALLRTASLLGPGRSPFDRLAIFDPAIYATSLLFPSLGDLLINSLLLLVVAMFFWSALRKSGALPKGLFAAWVTWTFILGHAAWTTHLLIGLVNDSSIDLDLYHVQGLNSMSLLAVFVMAVLLATWMLVTSALTQALVPGNQSHTLWVSGLAALLGSISVHHVLGVTDTALFLWPVPMVLLLVHALERSLRFMHVVLGLAILSVFVAHLLERQSDLREERERHALAERLAIREDPVVEQLFREMAPRLRSDHQVYTLLSSERPCSQADLDQNVRQRFFGGWWERYDVRLFAIGTSGQPICATDPEPPRSFKGPASVFADPTAAADMPDLFIEEQPGHSPFYHARVAVMPVDSLPPGQLIIELYPRSAAQGLSFPSLLLAGDDPLARRAQRYNYARYEGGQLVERSGSYEPPLTWPKEMGSGGGQWYVSDGHRHLAQGDPEGTLILLSRPIPGALENATTVSYLFALFSGLLTLVVALRTLLLSRGFPQLGIGAKVRLALVLFAIAGLVFFGLGTQRLLARQYDQHFEAAILEKARSVHQDLQQRMDGEPPLHAGHAPYLDHLLGRMSNVFFSDITIYTTTGRMLATSRPQIFAAGLLGRRMDAVAYTALVLGARSAFLHQEAIGSAIYRAAYMPLRDRRGQVLAYLALPAFADQAQREDERADVIVAVTNLFVLMFALSVLVAVFISNWTTRPLDVLKTALGKVALQGANEPIRYRGDDEIGQLVEVYNQKVAELRESAERLARSERESAWREMARQVAHEIKNPLTPMKLSIQHFQRTWTPDAPDAKERLERFSRGLVEQIDTLSGIAGAFSNFAQMPRARAEDLDLAEVAEAAMSVFRATPGMQCELRRETTGPLPVHADREQLLRVFNNLLKNAVQAIPDGQQGRITVVLRLADGGEAIAEVHDNGTGIAEEDRERIFRPNFTTKGSGMGLGLAMVQRMVESAGGRVWFESSVGSGSTFFVALPLRG